MKKMIALTVILACLFAITGWIIGFYAGNSRYITSQKGAFILSLGALEDLRNGNEDSALRSLENFCYSTALVVLRTSASTNEAAYALFVPRLLNYRMKYGTAQSTPVEMELDGLLGIER
jgi:hypothetical protein